MRNLHKSNADEAEGAPDEEHLGLQVCVVRVHHVWGAVRNGPVEEPVAGSGHRKALSAGLEWEEFTSNDPGDRAPGAGEEEDVDAHEGDSGFLCRQFGCASYCTSNRNDELTDAHADCAHEKKVATAKLFDHVQSREGGGDVHSVCDALNDERVLETSILEILRSVVD